MVDERHLLFVESNQWMFPVSAAVFKVAQSSIRQLRQDIGSLVVSCQGNVRKVQNIKRVGFLGHTWSDKLKNALFGNWEIRVEFGEPLPMSLEEFKGKVLIFLAYDFERGSPQWSVSEHLDATKGKILSAKSFEEVFEAIRFPALEDCLDVL